MHRAAKVFSGMAAIILCGGLLPAQEAEIEASKAQRQGGRLVLNAGVGYRNFSSAHFKSAALPAYHGVFAQSGVSGAVTDYATGIGKVGIDSFGNAFQDVAVVVRQSGGYLGGSEDYDFGDSLAPSLGLSYELVRKERLTLAASVAFQYYDLGAKVSVAGDAGTEISTYQTVLPGLPPAPERDPHVSDYIAAHGKAKFDLDLYVIDLGLRLDFQALPSLSLFVAAGPSFSLADMDSRYSSKLTRRLDGALLVGERGSDSSRDWVCGAYVACGAAYWFNERIGAALEIRYDEAFSDASTDYASQDLDGFGGTLKLMYRF
ncbi:MAG: hypothetical protein GX945_11925 [Lentisphaerae bacterium]|nr:hypothetical protein [Lentisphaerota bacterium]